MSAIARLRAYPLQYPEPNDRDRLRCVTLVRIDTEDGAVGWGECISQWPDSALAVATVAEEGLAPLLLGEDARDVRRHWERMRDHTFWYGRGGTASFAISAIDAALWDLAGKLAGVPVHRLLGGAVRDRFRACAPRSSGTRRPGLDGGGVRGLPGERLHGCQGRLGPEPDAQFGADPRRDEACVAACARRSGRTSASRPTSAAACGLNATQAIALARRLEPYDLMWFEDVLPHEDYEGWRRLRAAAPDAARDRRARVDAGGLPPAPRRGARRHRADRPRSRGGHHGHEDRRGRRSRPRRAGRAALVVERAQHGGRAARPGDLPDRADVRAQAAPLAAPARARGGALRPRRRRGARCRTGPASAARSTRPWWSATRCAAEASASADAVHVGQRPRGVVRPEAEAGQHAVADVDRAAAQRQVGTSRRARRSTSTHASSDAGAAAASSRSAKCRVRPVSATASTTTTARPAISTAGARVTRAGAPAAASNGEIAMASRSWRTARPRDREAAKAPPVGSSASRTRSPSGWSCASASHSSRTRSAIAAASSSAGARPTTPVAPAVTRRPRRRCRGGARGARGRGARRASPARRGSARRARAACGPCA